jgi:hypothetical protein
MHNARIETVAGQDGSRTVVAMFDLSETEISACAHAVGAARTEQFRNEALSADDVLAMREVTALADELRALAGYGGAVTMQLTPARLMALRDALEAFIAGREDAGFTREEDREAMACARELVLPLADLAGEALRAAFAEQ